MIEQLWSALWFARLGSEDVRLRFELGGEQFDNATQPVPRFLQAHRRAVSIADVLFPASCIGIVALPLMHPKPMKCAQVDSVFRALHNTGFQAAQVDEWKADIYTDSREAEGADWVVRSYDLSNDKPARDTLLWLAVAFEMKIVPRVAVTSFLLEPNNKLLLHVYDDRGTDVIAAAPAMLKEPYSKFSKWLLDNDRDRMTKLF